MEKWVHVQGYEGLYEISSYGRVRSLDHDTVHRGFKMYKKGRVLSVRRDGGGYHQYRLYKNGTSSYPKAHRMVAIAFLPNPDNMPEINHKDGDKDNNCVCNLEWVTGQRNVEHACAGHYTFINPVGEVVVIYNLNRFCRENNLSTPNMCKVISGIRNHHKGWKKYNV